MWCMKLPKLIRATRTNKLINKMNEGLFKLKKPTFLTPLSVVSGVALAEESVPALVAHPIAHGATQVVSLTLQPLLHTAPPRIRGCVSGGLQEREGVDRLAVDGD